MGVFSAVVHGDLHFCDIVFVHINPLEKSTKMSTQMEELKKGWAMFDKDGSQEIDMDEFKSFMNSDVVTKQVGGALDNDLIEKIFKAIDVSGDGKIDFKEFMKVIHEKEDGHLEIRIKLNQ